MLGTLVNCAAIVAGSLLGLLFKNGIPEKYNKTVMQAVALAVMLVGLRSALACDDLMMIIVSVCLGALAGEWIGIESRLKQLGDFLESKMAKDNNGFSAGFVTASLLYCVGSMAIVGSLESGLAGNHATLFAKAFLDGTISIILTSSLGFGVMFSAVPVFIYQGGITLAASVMKPLLIPSVVAQMSGVGGLLILGLGLNMIREQKIKVGNMLPGIFIPLVYYLFQTLI
ncbi:MAG: DUF554 domain-containing protein [Desulfobacterales bacterium]|nr:DUF554 domain-containing protein [Desulfobacterales bacterium]